MRPARTALSLLLAVALGLACGAASAADGTQAAIVIPRGASPERRAAAERLQRYVAESTGVRLPIADRPGEGLAIHVGRSPYVDQAGLNLAALDADGFVLKLIDQHNYVIAGPDEWGTEFGVCDFLERAVGVRWLLPEPDGTDVPRNATLELPPTEIRSQPAFFSRSLSGLSSPADREWARRLRLHHRLDMHHNLLNLFPPSRYARTDPDIYPVYDGRRYIPARDDDHNWQPNFAADRTAEVAVAEIQRYFREHPEATSFSLGINDCRRFDESPASLAREAGGTNHLGLRNVSDSYYRWCNTVVERVLRELPDKYFGCLAYINVADPPTGLKLNPRLVPFLTHDRLMWCDGRLKAAAQDLEQRWTRAAETRGWYDYVYGMPYCLPRVYPHAMAEYLRWGQAHGVRALYAEAYPDWSEGPKLYVYLRLLWDPQVDVDAVLADWYERCVGRDAAPYLKDYYDIWERFWTAGVQAAPWWPQRPETYLYFNDPRYLDAVNEADIARSQELLERCVALAQTPPQRARAERLRSGFAFYRASALAYRARLVCATQVLKTEDDARAAAADAALRLRLGEYRRKLLDPRGTHPLVHLGSWTEYCVRLHGDDWGRGGLWRLYDWAQSSRDVRAAVESYAADGESAELRAEARLLLRVLDHLGPPRSENASFDDAELSPWQTYVAKQAGSIMRARQQTRTGTYSLLCDRLREGGVRQRVPVVAGAYAALGYAYVPEGQTGSGTVAISVVLHGEDDKGWTVHAAELAPAPGRWTGVMCPLEIPAAIGGQRVAYATLQMSARNYESGRVYLDDIALYPLGE